MTSVDSEMTMTSLLNLTVCKPFKGMRLRCLMVYIKNFRKHWFCKCQAIVPSYWVALLSCDINSNQSAMLIAQAGCDMKILNI